MDSFRAFGLFLVFLGHTNHTSRPLMVYIYSFHIPLFFIISGMFFKENDIHDGFRPYLQKKVYTRLVPYFFFGLLTYPLWLVMHIYRLGGELHWQTPAYRPLLGMLYGNGVDHYLIHNILLWFFACLFVTEILFFIVVKLCVTRRAVMISILVILAAGYFNSTLEHTRLPFGFDVSLVAIFFYGIGYLFRERLLSMKPRTYAVLLLGLTGLVASILNGKVDMNGNRYNNILLFIAASISLFLFYLQIMKLLPSMRLLELIGKHSLSIFPLQVVVFSLIKMALELTGMRPEGVNDLFAVALAAVGLLLALPMSLLLRKYVPFLVGARQ